MNSNGLKHVNPNKWGEMCKKYICPICEKTHYTSLENFIRRYPNYARIIWSKAIKYELISYLSIKIKQKS